MTEVVAYLRRSTGLQDNSLEVQRQRISEAGYEPVAWFEDTKSGKLATRPGLSAALRALEAGLAGGMVVADLDRVGRAGGATATLLEQFWENGWAFIALNVGVDSTTIGGQTALRMIADVGWMEGQMISERTRRALADVDCGRPRTVPERYREHIRNMRESGHSYQAIANHMNQEGVPTGQGGKKWYASTVSNIAKEEIDVSRV